VSCAATADDLIQTVLGVAQGELRCSPRAAAMVFGRLAAGTAQPGVPRASVLTSREREVAVLLHQGLSNKEIGKQLHIGVATVKNHLHHIFDKLDVGTRGEAVARLRFTPGRWARRTRRSTTP
jgi:DNA-binding NarL/FixJ family response regulator